MYLAPAHFFRLSRPHDIMAEPQSWLQRRWQLVNSKMERLEGTAGLDSAQTPPRWRSWFVKRCVASRARRAGGDNPGGDNIDPSIASHLTCGNCISSECALPNSERLVGGARSGGHTITKEKHCKVESCVILAIAVGRWPRAIGRDPGLEKFASAEQLHLVGLCRTNCWKKRSRVLQPRV